VGEQKEVSQPEACGAPVVAITMRYRGKERTADIPLSSAEIEVLALEAMSRDLGITELIGQILVAAINKDMIHKIMDPINYELVERAAKKGHATAQFSPFPPRRSARSPRPPSGAPNATARRRNGRRSQAAAAANSTPSATGTGRSRASPPTFERGEAVIVAATISQTSSQGCSTMRPTRRWSSPA